MSSTGPGQTKGHNGGRQPDVEAAPGARSIVRPEDEGVNLQAKAGELAQRAGELVRANPLLAIVCAAAAGFVFARLVSRR